MADDALVGLGFRLAHVGSDGLVRVSPEWQSGRDPACQHDRFLVLSDARCATNVFVLGNRIEFF